VAAATLQPALGHLDLLARKLQGVPRSGLLRAGSWQAVNVAQMRIIGNLFVNLLGGMKWHGTGQDVRK
jgi:hypothetical protein